MAKGDKKDFSSWYSTKDPLTGKFPYQLFAGGKIQRFKNGSSVYPVDAIANYVNNSRDINTHLAYPDDGNLGYGPLGQVSESDKAYIAGIKETIKKLDSSPKTKVPDNVYAGIGETRLDIIKKQIGNQLRSQKDVDDASGKTFTLPGFLSTSKAKKVGMNFSQRSLLDIKTKKMLLVLMLTLLFQKKCLLNLISKKFKKRKEKNKSLFFLDHHH